jgi:hypothetical protein
MMRRESFMTKKVLLVFFIQLLILPLFGFEAVELMVRLYDRTVYTPKTAINLHLTLKNNDSSPYRFHAAENRLFNLDFDVRNLRNLPLEHSQHFKIERSSSQRVFYREMVLLPGEEYSFIADLRDYVNIEVPGVYTIQGSFFPDLNRNLTTAGAETSLTSNTLTVQIHPHLSDVPAYRERLDAETGRILVREKLPPDEVVAYMLNSRQRGEWPKFFLYLDVEKLMLQDPRLRIEYRNKSEQERFLMVEQYREALQKRQVDTDILVVPTRFTIVNTSYTPSEATVEVIQTFEYPDFSENRKYTYLLGRDRGYWMIHDYYVRNLGTE